MSGPYGVVSDDTLRWLMRTALDLRMENSPYTETMETMAVRRAKELDFREPEFIRQVIASAADMTHDN